MIELRIVYLIPILSLFILLATFLVACSNEQQVTNTAPTYPQTFETDTSRNIVQELVQYLCGNDQTTDYKPSYFYPDIFDSNKTLVVSDIEFCHFLINNMLELRADFPIFQSHPTILEEECFFRLFIPILLNYNSHNFTLIGRIRPSLLEVTATLQNTSKDFRENINDSYPIRTINCDSNQLPIETYFVEIEQQLGKCVSNTLQVFDNFFRIN